MSILKARSKLSGGGSVLWRPTPCTGVPTRKKYTLNDSYGLDKCYGWLAQRQPATVARPSEVDITEQLQSREPFEFCWDMRWLLKFPRNALDILQSHKRVFGPRFSNSDIMEPGTGQYLIAPVNHLWQPGILRRLPMAETSHSVEKAVYSYTDSLLDRPEDSHIGMKFIRVMDAV